MSQSNPMTDCLVRYLYGAKNRNLATLGCYGAGRENYDHQAILTAAQLFRTNTRNANRLMLVVSDGLPGGVNYGGDPAIRATREAVESVRRQGIDVRGVALAEHGHERIYGTRSLVHFTDLSTFVADMRKLVTSLVRQVTERGCRSR